MVKIKEVDETLIIYITAKRIDRTNAKQLIKMIKFIIKPGTKIVELNFNKVKRIDAYGIAKLLLIQKYLCEIGGELYLTNIKSSYIKKIRELTDLDEVIKIK